MKLKIIIALCLLFTGCSESFLNEKHFYSQEREANFILDKLLVALEKRDKYEIKNLFSENLISDSITLDYEIIEMIDYFEGSIKSYKKIGTVAGEVEYRNGDLYLSDIGNALCEEIITDKYTYMISFSAVLINENDKESEGIWRIWIGKNENDYLIVGSTKGSHI